MFHITSLIHCIICIWRFPYLEYLERFIHHWCTEHFLCARQCVLLAWGHIFALEELRGQLGSILKLKAGLFVSFRETQWSFFLINKIELSLPFAFWNTGKKIELSNIFPSCFFHSPQHLGLGPCHPMLFFPVLTSSLPIMCNDHWGQFPEKSPLVASQYLQGSCFLAWQWSFFACS